jgi:hypothetical protein
MNSINLSWFAHSSEHKKLINFCARNLEHYININIDVHFHYLFVQIFLWHVLMKNYPLLRILPISSLVKQITDAREPSLWAMAGRDLQRRRCRAPGWQRCRLAIVLQPHHWPDALLQANFDTSMACTIGWGLRWESGEQAVWNRGDSMCTDERERPQFRTGSTPGEEAFYNASSISRSTGRSRRLARRRPHSVCWARRGFLQIFCYTDGSINGVVHALRGLKYISMRSLLRSVFVWKRSSITNQ